MNKVEHFIIEHELVQSGDKIVVGVSGGADSLCLLYELVELSKKIPFEIIVVHVHHHLRGLEADKDAKFVKEICGSLNLPCFVYDADIKGIAKSEGLGLEEAGRLERYRIFNECIDNNKANKIAVAHHQNDLAETMLFRIVRGTGLSGLEGIVPKRDNIIRPLLCLTRAEIDDYMKENGYSYRTDQTNHDESYARNRIRHQVIPQLMEVNDRAVEHIVALAKRVKEQNQYIEKQARLSYHEVIHKNKGKILIYVDKLLKNDLVIQKSILRMAIDELIKTKKDIHEIHIEQLLSLANGKTGKEINLPYQLIAERSYDLISLWQGEDETEVEQTIYQIELSQGDTMVKLHDGEGMVTLTFSTQNREKDYTKKFDCDKIGNTVFIRKCKEADEIVIDQQGHHKLVSRHFIDQKVPRSLRKEKWVMTNGKEVIWIVGDRVSEQFKTTGNTKNTLYVNYGREEH